MTWCDFQWAACGVVGAVCCAPGAVLCVACVRQCACSDVCAVRSCCGCADVLGHAILVCLYAAFESAMCHGVGCWRAMLWVTLVMTRTCRCDVLG